MRAFMHWYYALDNQRLGPVSQTEFERLVAAKTISDDTLVWRRGMQGWQTLREVLAADPGAVNIAPPPLPPPVSPDSEMSDPACVSGQQAAADKVPPVRYAGFFIRVVARLIDVVILSCINEVVFRVLVATKLVGNPSFKEATDLFRPEFIHYLLASSLIGLLVALVYEVFFIRRFSATPGKLAMGLRLVRADGSPLSAARIIGRHFADMLNGFTFCLTYLMVAFDEKEHRGLHDHIADTRVVRKD